MALMIWTNDYSVGVPELDSDHIILFSLINHIHDAKQAGRDEEAIANVLSALIEYAQIHFRREEGWLKKQGYPHLERHTKEHEVLNAQLTDLHGEYKRTQSPEVSEEIMEVLNYWLAEHILEVDMDYNPHNQPT